MARGIGAKGVKNHVEQPFGIRGSMQVRPDNGREFIAGTLLDWLGEQEG